MKAVKDIPTAATPHDALSRNATLGLGRSAYYRMTGRGAPIYTQH